MTVRAPHTRERWIIVALWTFVVVFCALVIVDAWPLVEEALIPEQASTTWLEGALLLSCAALALVLALNDAAWAWASAFLLAMALDERLMGHERIKEFILFDLYDGDLDRMGVVGNLPMLAYVIAGAIGLRWFWPRLLPGAPRRFAVMAVLLGVVAVVFDVFFAARVWQAVEELIEVGADTSAVATLLLMCSRQRPSSSR